MMYPAFAGAPAMYWDLLRTGTVVWGFNLSCRSAPAVRFCAQPIEGYRQCIFGCGAWHRLRHDGMWRNDLRHWRRRARQPPHCSGTSAAPSVDIKIVDQAGRASRAKSGRQILMLAMLMTEYCGRAKATSECCRMGG